MPPEKRMRYYPAVGPAIPRGSAGPSRVTHPFAGCPRLPQGPLDLHVLSTPPAFVLSQDQTLQWIVRMALRTAVTLSHDSASESLEYVQSNSPRSPERLRINESASHTLRFLSLDCQTAWCRFSGSPESYSLRAAMSTKLETFFSRRRSPNCWSANALRIVAEPPSPRRTWILNGPHTLRNPSALARPHICVSVSAGARRPSLM